MRFLAMANHHVFEPAFCNPAAGWGAPLFAAEGQMLCEHLRVIWRSNHLTPRTIYDWRHYLAVLRRKPGALGNGAPFAEFPPAFRPPQDLMLRKPGGGREPLGDACIACRPMDGRHPGAGSASRHAGGMLSA